MRNSNVWDNFPNELKDMLILLKKGNIYVISGIINYLLQYRTKGHNVPDTSETYLACVNRFFSDCLFPYEFCVDLWKDYLAQLEEILDYSEHLLKTLDVNKDLSSTPKTETNTEANLVVLSQNLDTYFCTLYKTQKRYDEYLLRLRKIFAATKRNIEYLLSSPNVTDLYKLNITLHDDLNIMGSEYFEEPLSFTVNELASFDESIEILAKVYAEYYDFLNKYESQVKEPKIVLSKLKAKAQERLNNLCTYALGYIDEEIQTAYEDIQKMIDSRLKLETQIYGGTDNDN